MILQGMIKYFSMFSGIGGFELGIKQAIPDAKCIGFSEIDKWAISIYKKHFKDHKNYGDATKINPKEIPDFDLLVGGFPCQAFSIAGKRRGFSDTRGTLFFEIARVLREKQPRFLLLENVKGLLSHDEGNSANIIMSTLDELGYDCQWNICNSKNYGVPQSRERIFIVGHLRTSKRSAKQIFTIRHNHKAPSGLSGHQANTLTAGYGQKLSNGSYIGVAKELNQTNLKINDGTQQALCSSIGDKTGLYAVPVLTPDRPNTRQNGRRFKDAGDPSFTLTAQDRHGFLMGGRIRKFTPKECERLQGFPDDWTEFGSTGGMFDAQISDSQRYTCCGNAVTVNVVAAIFNRLFKYWAKKQ